MKKKKTIRRATLSDKVSPSIKAKVAALHTNQKFFPTEANRRMVAMMVFLGLRNQDIARCLGNDGITEQTLVKHFQTELEITKNERLARVADTLYQQALAGNTTAAIFILKCKAGWKETNQMELNGQLQIVKRVIGVQEDEL